MNDVHVDIDYVAYFPSLFIFSSLCVSSLSARYSIDGMAIIENEIDLFIYFFLFFFCVPFPTSCFFFQRFLPAELS